MNMSQNFSGVFEFENQIFSTHNTNSTINFGLDSILLIISMHAYLALPKFSPLQTFFRLKSVQQNSYVKNILCK